VSGSRIVVGIPAAAAEYDSSNQADPYYNLPLGVTGGAVTYSLSGNTWSFDKLLTPFDNAMPNDTSFFQTYVPDGWNQAAIFWDGVWHYYDIGGWNVPDRGTALYLGPHTYAMIIDYNGGDAGFAFRVNASDTGKQVDIPDFISNEDIDFIMVGSEHRANGEVAGLRQFGTNHNYPI